MSQLVAHSRIFRLFMKGNFDAYAVTFGQNGPKLNSRLVYCSRLYGIYFILGVLFSDSILAWQADPMVINLAETGLPVRNLDFPAVTGRNF